MINEINNYVTHEGQFNTLQLALADPYQDYVKKLKQHIVGAKTYIWSFSW